MKKLFDRTPEQVEEEQTLLSELRKIEQRKKERDRKTQDLQKLITAADHQVDPRKTERKSTKKNNNSNRNRPAKIDSSHVSILRRVTTRFIFKDSFFCSVHFNQYMKKIDKLVNFLNINKDSIYFYSIIQKQKKKNYRIT